MSVRKFITGLLGLVVVLSSWLVVSAPAAHAEPTFTPDANDIVGVGSDTTMHAMHFIAEGVTVNGVHHPGYNELVAPNPADAKLVSFDAFGERVSDSCPEVPNANRPAHPVAGEIVPCLNLRGGSPDLWRPNGSGNGKKALFQAMTGPGADPNTTADDISVGGASGNPDVNFARSSAPIQPGAETTANLWAFPFAFDGFKPGVRAAGSNAPATISAADFLKIYKGDYTNWNQLGGSDGVIKPLVPQPGSGTYQVFNTSMTALNGGNASWNTNPNSEFAQEHDDTLVKNNPNAVAPFSTGRAKAFATTVEILTGGWSVDRALFNVVRNADLDQPFVTDLFETSGFLCSAEAQPLIEASGFEQLAPPSLGGICGEATQGTPTNFTVSPDRSTVTTLAASATAPRTVKLTAQVNEGRPAAEGSVTFKDAITGGTVGTVAVASRQASVTLSNVPVGTRRYTATFVPTDPTFSTSDSSEVSVLVKTSSSITETFPKAIEPGKKGKGSVTVTLDGVTAKAGGTVTIKEGNKVLVTKTLANGTVKVKLPKLKAGKHKLTIVWAGDSNGTSSTLEFKIKQKKPKPKK
jgi:ABC-type phosphate transport system substrate-binding protein